MPTEDTADKTAQPPTPARQRFREAAHETQRLLDRYTETFAELNRAYVASLVRMSEACGEMVKENITAPLPAALGVSPLDDDPDDSDEEAGS